MNPPSEVTVLSDSESDSPLPPLATLDASSFFDALREASVKLEAVFRDGVDDLELGVGGLMVLLRRRSRLGRVSGEPLLRGMPYDRDSGEPLLKVIAGERDSGEPFPEGMTDGRESEEPLFEGTADERDSGELLPEGMTDGRRSGEPLFEGMADERDSRELLPEGRVDERRSGDPLLKDGIAGGARLPELRRGVV